MHVFEFYGELKSTNVNTEGRPIRNGFLRKVQNTSIAWMEPAYCYIIMKRVEIISKDSLSFTIKDSSSGSHDSPL